MGIFNYLRSLIRPSGVKKPRTHKHPHSTQLPPAPAPNAPIAAVVTAPVATAPQIVAIQVRYCDQATNVLLTETKVITGHPGDILILDWLHFPGRIFARIENYTDTIPNESKTITLFYQEVVAGPVTVYHRGLNGQLLAPPETLTGTVDMAFHAVSLKDRRREVIGATEKRGVFQTTAQTIRFTYEDHGFDRGRIPDAAYIEVTNDKPVYATPTTNHQLTDPLPIGTIWQVFGLVRTQDEEPVVWFNLGGNQWVTADETRPRKQNPFLPAPLRLEETRVRFTSTGEAIDTIMRVVGPQSGAAMWSKPYGTMDEQRLTDGYLFHVRQRVVLSDQSVWYELDDGHFVQAMFTSIEEEY